jgi:UDP-2,4-diacetamido-2,4,6-trideoxy-beta-L-altropyranose hydrolase
MVNKRKIQVAIRVDAGPKIGTGHLMRTLTLADMLKKNHVRVRFVSRNMPIHLQRMLEIRGHDVTSLPTAPAIEVAGDLAHSRWLDVSQTRDADDTCAALSDGLLEWVIVDHYALDRRWECLIRRCCSRIFVIDDLADRSHECDILLDQNLFLDIHDRYVGKVPTKATLLLGPRYALLREEFHRARAKETSRAGRVQRVLILLGGVDAKNHTSKVINGLIQLPAPAPTVDVVIGFQHPALEEITGLCQRHHFRLHVQAENVAELMVMADLAIGAGGSTSWERCCVGLPTVCLTQADNQVHIARGLEASGAVVNLGDGCLVSAEIIRDAVLALIGEPGRLISLSRSAGQLVDGLGAQRVCEQLLSRI